MVRLPPYYSPSSSLLVHTQQRVSMIHAVGVGNTADSIKIQQYIPGKGCGFCGRRRKDEACKAFRFGKLVSVSSFDAICVGAAWLCGVWNNQFAQGMGTNVSVRSDDSTVNFRSSWMAICT